MQRLKKILYALLSENHGWIHGSLEDGSIQYGNEIKVYDLFIFPYSRSKEI